MLKSEKRVTKHGVVAYFEPVSCSYCGKEVLKSRYEISIHRDFTCSKECFKKWITLHSLGATKADLDNPWWTTGKERLLSGKGGYVYIHTPFHPGAQKRREKYLPKHRYVIEKSLGRFLNSNEVIHHIDRNKTNNSLENLLLCSPQEHTAVHKSLSRCIKELLGFSNKTLTFDRDRKRYTVI